MKKVLSVLTSLFVICAMVFSMTGSVVHAESVVDSGYCGKDDTYDTATNIKWEILNNDDGNYTLRLTGSGEMSDSYNVPGSTLPISIPGAYMPYAPWIKYNDKITKAEVGEGITTIARSCFSGSKITSITLPSTIKTIHECAFYNCSSLKTITLNEGLETIEQGNFDSTGIQSITLPSTLKTIAGNNFRYFNLSNVTINGGTSANLKIENNCLYSADGKTVISGTPDTNGYLNIPEGVETIGNCAFEHKGVKSLSLPSTLKTIEGYAFNYNTDLGGDLVIPDSVTTLGEGAFCQTAITSVVVGSGVKDFTLTFAKCNQLKKAVLKNVESFDMAFELDPALSDVELPETLKTIGYVSFHNCTSLTSINLPSSLKKIDMMAFWKSGLTSITLPEGLEEIGEDAFTGTQISSVVIPSSCTSFSVSDFPENCVVTKKAAARTTNVLQVTDPKLPSSDLKATSKLPDLSVPKGYSKVTAKITDLDGNSDVAGSSLRPLLLQATSASTKGIYLSYKKVKGAAYYKIYGAKENNNLSLISKQKGLSLNVKRVSGKKLVNNKYYHFVVIAYNKSGKVLATSKTVHTATGRYKNIKKIVVKNPQKVMKKNRSYTLKLQVTSSKGISKTYRKISYESSNNKVATISPSGKLKALNKGKATITIYGQNGVYTTMNVEVK